MSGKKSCLVLAVLVVLVVLLAACGPADAPAPPAPTATPAREMYKIELWEVGDSAQFGRVTVTFEGTVPETDGLQYKFKIGDCDSAYAQHVPKEALREGVSAAYDSWLLLKLEEREDGEVVIVTTE